MAQIFLVSILVLVTGISAGCSATLGAAADSWIGAQVDDFVVVAGAPRRQFEMQDGRIAYTWYLSCEITLVTKNGIVQSWSSPNCAGIQPVPGKWVRQPRS